VTDTIERRSSLSPSGPEGSARSNDDFVILDDLVRDLPRLLAKIERRIRDREERRKVDPTEEEADDRRRLRVRRWAVLVLAAVAVAFLFLEFTGAVPHAFSRHGPLLAFAVYLMVAFTFRPMPPHAPKNPASRAFLAMVAFWFCAGLAIQFRELFPEKAGLFQGIYLGVGGASLVAAARLSRKPLQPAGKALQRELKAAGDSYGPRERVLAACREALEQIGRHTPREAEALGWLDLSGPEQPEKLVHEDHRGRRYRGLWWRLRLPWKDGIRLRVIGIEEVLLPPAGDREGVWTLWAKLAVSRRCWRTEPRPFRPKAAGALQVEDLVVRPSQVSARIVTQRWAFQPDDLVALIRILEERIQPLDATTLPAGGQT
jgi:hypothetical protein